MKITLAWSFLTVFLIAPIGQAADMALSSAGAPAAPMEVSKGKSTIVGPLSSSDRQDILNEFKGLIALGMHPESYERWGGRSMADCFTPDKGSSQHWSYKCEVITPQCNGFYYFYPSESRHASTLQAVEVKAHVSETQVMDDFKTALRGLFGRETTVEARTAKVPARGAVKRWETQHDLADLFMDVSENPLGLVRFVWKRGSAASSDQASTSQTLASVPIN